MNVVSLQTQRQLEKFLTQAGICPVEVSSYMHFNFHDHQLYIEGHHHQLWITAITQCEIDDVQLMKLYERVFSGLTTGYLLRPFRIREGLALNVTLDDAVSSEQLTHIHRMMLRIMSPWNKRNY
jgi:hypothetical protein